MSEDDSGNGKHCLNLKSKRHGSIRSISAETKHEANSTTKPLQMTDDLYIATQALGRSNQQTEWVAEDRSYSSGVCFSATEHFIESLSNTAKVEESDQDAVVLTKESTIRPEQGTLNDDEPSKGLAGILKKLRENGVLGTAEQSQKEEFDLTYRDKVGNILTPKEAYKELSRKFHGTKLGKRRLDKKLRHSRVNKPE
jgi:hypothetical protein